VINLDKYDFIDFGSNKGGCIDFARKKLRGKKGLAIERSEERANELIKRGYKCLCADLLNIELPENAVSFVTISHLLEHLHSLDQVEHILQLAAHTAKDFIFIEGPSFDFDDYLHKLGFKFFWFDSCGHKLRVTTSQLISILEKINLKDYAFLPEYPYIVGSSSDDIHSIASPKNQNKYIVGKHPDKRSIVFDKNIYRSFILYVWLKRMPNERDLLHARKKFKFTHGRIGFQ
jgi:hypothetical protein